MVQEAEIKQFWSDHPMIPPGDGFDHRTATPEEIFAQAERMIRRGTTIQAKGAPLLSDYIDYSVLAGKQVLEIVYGVGWLLNELVKAGADVEGIDLSESHFGYSSYLFRGNEKVNLQIGSAENLPYGDGHFDFAAAWGVLHHASDDQRCYDELHRVLKPGGRAFLMLYRCGGPKYRWHKLLRRGIVDGGLFRHGFRVDDFINSVTDDDDGDGAPISRHYKRGDLHRLFRHFASINIKVSGNAAERDNLPAHKLPITHLLPALWRENLVKFSGAYWMITLTK
jgi:SAM-dependent methyltransferase